jgi:hypothetical protein
MLCYLIEMAYLEAGDVSGGFQAGKYERKASLVRIKGKRYHAAGMPVQPAGEIEFDQNQIDRLQRRCPVCRMMSSMSAGEGPSSLDHPCALILMGSANGPPSSVSGSSKNGSSSGNRPAGGSKRLDDIAA